MITPATAGAQRIEANLSREADRLLDLIRQLQRRGIAARKNGGNRENPLLEIAALDLPQCRKRRLSLVSLVARIWRRFGR
jgi:hypothetical protein